MVFIFYLFAEVPRELVINLDPENFLYYILYVYVMGDLENFAICSLPKANCKLRAE